MKRSSLSNEDTFYDFNRERLAFKVFGVFTILREPLSHFILNIICITFALFIYSYITVMGVITIIATTSQKIVMMQAFYSMGNILVAIGMSSAKIVHENALIKTMDQIRAGIFHYNDNIDSEYLDIRKFRIRQIRFFVSFITMGLFFTGFFNIVVVPLMRYLNSGGDENVTGINPYLPFPLLSPFDTRTFLGYATAFSSNVLTLFFMYTCYACHEETYLSSAFQLAAEYEVLNYSLQNVQRRASHRLKQLGFPLKDENSISDLYGFPEFQKCLYGCLRENVLHHLAILRIKKSLTPYLESANFVAIFFVSLLVALAIFIFIENPRSQLTLISDIFGFLPMCWSGQLVINMSEETKNSLYATPWPYFDEKCKLLLKIVMSNTQEPVTLRAKFLNVVLCLETFANMFSAGYKMLNIIR